MILNKTISSLLIISFMLITACSNNEKVNISKASNVEGTNPKTSVETVQKKDNTNSTTATNLDNENTIEFKSEKIQFTTPDNFIIKGDLYNQGKCFHTILLLPMLGHTKESYTPLISKLLDNKFNVLAIDMRGHGQSRKLTNGKKHSFESFTKEDWEKLTLDVSSALKFLCDQQINCTNVYIIGASIGANAAIISAKKHPGKVKGIVAISPGLNFHGLTPMNFVHNMKPALLIAAKDDKYSFDTINDLKEVNKESITTQTYTEGGHGTDLFETQPQLLNTIINWINENPSNIKHPKECK